MSMYHADGIVLRNRDLGEADRVVTLLCPDKGKIDAVARGARRPRNRLVGLTLPFNLLRMSLFKGHGLDQLSQAEGIKSFQGLRGDLTKLACASYLAELVMEFLPEHEPNPAVFNLFVRSLASLEQNHPPENLLRFFELRLMDLSGFRPSLDACLACGAPWDGFDEVLFAPADGGFYCRECAKNASVALSAVGRETLQAMRQGLAGDVHFMSNLAPPARRQIGRIMQAFIEARLDRELRSLRFLTGILAQDEAVNPV